MIRLTLVNSLLIMGCVIVSCGITPVEYDDTMLDGPLFNDISLTDKTYQLSTQPVLDTFNRETPVVICVHGYTACTFEWEEFRAFANEDGRVYTSLVLLGAHGRDIEDFEGSTWKEWQAPIMKEYDALVEKGFKRISLAGSSTGGALLIEYCSGKSFDTKSVKPEEIFLIDPIVIPSSKLLHLIGFVGPIIGNSPQERVTDIQKQHWYSNRPANTLDELNKLCELLRVKLEHGVKLPEGAHAKCYKSKIDDAVDPVSAVLIYKGLRKDDGGKIEVEMIDSDMHVFTQLAAREEVSVKDVENQQRVFREIIDKTVGHTTR